MKKTKKRSAISWVIEFAGQKKPNYIFSVLLAVCKVVFGLMPYLYMADIVKKLLEMNAGTLEKDMSLLTASIVKMAVFWLLCRVCHAISTTLSHAATFEVLANIRRQLTEKLSKLPLGSVLSQSSGTYTAAAVQQVGKRFLFKLCQHIGIILFAHIIDACVIRFINLGSFGKLLHG